MSYLGIVAAVFFGMFIGGLALLTYLKWNYAVSPTNTTQLLKAFVRFRALMLEEQRYELLQEINDIIYSLEKDEIIEEINNFNIEKNVILVISNDHVIVEDYVVITRPCSTN